MKAENDSITGWEASIPVMSSIDLAYGKLKSDDFKWLKKACKTAYKNKKESNKKLAGHLKEEYYILERNDKFEKFIFSLIENSPLKNHLQRLKILTENRPLVLDTLWVNYQKKYEFNPMHDHAGVFSFIIFVQIPYDLKKEDNCFPKVVDSRFSTSRTEFIITDMLGNISHKTLEVDKSFEGKIVLFPAQLKHQVYPFYTSNNYRITVSGNLRIKV